MKCGKSHEEIAISTYVKKMIKSHKDVQMSQPGLLVHRSKPYLRASPDALIFCSCHGTRLVEVKCPWNARYLHPEQAIKDGMIEYISTEDDKYTLHPRKRGYYVQIQGLMAITDCTTLPGHFVIWTKGEIKIIEVPFDQSYWIASESKLEEFFRNDVIPGILMPRSMKIANLDDEVKKLSLDSPEIDFTIKEENMLTNEVEEVQIEENNASAQVCTIQNQDELDKVEEIHEEMTDSCYSHHQDEVEEVHEEVKDSYYSHHQDEVEEKIHPQFIVMSMLKI